MKDSIATVLLRSTRRLSSKLKFAAVSTLKNLPIFGVLYYSLISGAFWREQRAVLAGREQYSRQLRELKSTSALLRRNTHRLEKGLIMRPQKPVFASNYIGETVDILVAPIVSMTTTETSCNGVLTCLQLFLMRCRRA